MSLLSMLYGSGEVMPNSSMQPWSGLNEASLRATGCGMLEGTSLHEAGMLSGSNEESVITSMLMHT